MLRVVGSIQQILSCVSHRPVRLPHLLAYGLLILGLTLPVTHSVHSAPTAISSSVWFVDHKTLKRIDAISHELQAEVYLDKKTEALAIDASDQSVWVLGDTTVRKFDSQLTQILSISLKELRKSIKAQGHKDTHFDDVENLVVDAFTGFLWLVGKKGVVVLDRNGALLASYRAPDKIKDIELSLNQRAWLLTKKALIEIDAGGRVMQSVNIKGMVTHPQGLVVDSLAHVIWITAKKSLYRFNASNIAESPLTVALTPANDKDEFETRAMAIDPVTGVVWLAGKHTLLAFNRIGELLFERDLKTDGIKEADALSWDPVSGTLYIGGKKSLSQYRADGSPIWQLSMNKKLRALGTVPFVLTPAVSIIAPPDGIHSNNARPLIEFSLGANCNSTGCDAFASYLDSLTIQATLDNIVIGSSFIVGGGSARYTPPEDLAEGNHDIAGQAIDQFGHVSNLAEGSFVVDTVAPVFKDVTPQDGMTVNETSIHIEGRVIDASPVNVMLLDDAGEILSMGGADFSFPVTLEQGLNRYTLLARDAAGNETGKPLNITLGGQLEIEITRPAEGATVEAGTIYIAGKFKGPANSGVTVNGVLAQSAGQFFVATISVSEGQQTLTAKLTTFGGKSKEASVTVTVIAAAPGNSNGQYGLEVTTSTAPDVPYIDTVAGNGSSVYSGDGGPAKEAGLAYPAGITVTSDGVIYFADRSAHRIRRISVDGIIDTVAGSGKVGYGNGAFTGDGGPATAARLSNPNDVAVSQDGSLLIVDAGNKRIRRVSPDGTITTIAGTGSTVSSGDGGPATSAGLSYPNSVVIGADQNIFFSESGGHRIRKIAADGIITTVAGTGSQGFSGDGGVGTSARLDHPTGLTLGPDNTLYIIDSYNNRIRKLDSNGIISTVADSVSSFDIAVGGEGALYLAQGENCQIQKIAPDGSKSVVTGGRCGYWDNLFEGDGGPATEGRLAGPMAIVLATDNTIFFSDSANHRVRTVFKPNTAIIEQADIKISYTSYSGGRPTIEVDFDGDGVVDFTREQAYANTQITHYYHGPGAYLMTVTFTRSNGETHQIQKVILIEDEEAKDKVIRALWSGMNQALKNKDVVDAVRYLNESAIRKYQPVFQALLPHMEEIVNSYSPLYKIDLSSSIGEYAINRNINGENKLFLVYFLKGGDGIWRMDAL